MVTNVCSWNSAAEQVNGHRHSVRTVCNEEQLQQMPWYYRIKYSMVYKTMKHMVTLHVVLEQKGSSQCRSRCIPNQETGFFFFFFLPGCHCMQWPSLEYDAMWCRCLCIKCHSILVVIISAANLPCPATTFTVVQNRLNWWQLVDLCMCVYMTVMTVSTHYDCSCLILLFKNFQMYNFRGLSYPWKCFDMKSSYTKFFAAFFKLQ